MVKWWGVLLLFVVILAGFISAEIISLDPCAGETIITQDSSNIYVSSQCFDVTFTKTLTGTPFSFYDKYNKDAFDLKLYSLQDVNVANANQKKTTSFESLGMTASIIENGVRYTSPDGKIQLTYIITGNSVKAGITINDWVSNYASGKLNLRTRVHKEDTASSHFVNTEAVADSITQALAVTEEINGVNKFYVQTLFTGKSFNFLEQDPIYYVDYSSNPATHLIDGSPVSTPDTSFGTQTDITSGISDNSPATTYLINPYISPITAFTESSLTSSSTTNTSFVTKVTKTFTVTQAGVYWVAGNADVSLSATDRSVYVITQIDGSYFGESHYKLKENTNWLTYSSHKALYLTTGSHTLSLKYKTTDSGKTAYIRNAKVTALYISGIQGSVVEYEQTATTSYVPYNTLNFNVPTTGFYLITASGTSTSADGGKSLYERFRIDGTTYGEIYRETTDSDTLKDYRAWGLLKVINLNAGSHTATIDAYREDSNGGAMSYLSLSALPLSNMEYQYWESETESSTTNTIFQDKLSQTFTPSVSNDYMIFATAEIGEGGDRQIEVTLQIDGIDYCDMIFKPQEETSPRDTIAFSCGKLLNLNSSLHTFKIRYRTLDSGRTAYIKRARIFVFKTSLPETPARAISTKWNQIYDPNYNWYLRVYKTSSGSNTITVKSYDSLYNVGSPSVTSLLSGTGWFNINVSGLVQYETITKGLTFTALRVYDWLSSLSLSEIVLRKETNDSDPPIILGCSIIDDAVCKGSITFQCLNITDNLEVAEVKFRINGINYTTTKSGNTYSYTITPTTNGTINYSFDKVFAEDISGLNSELIVNLNGEYSCLFEDWLNIQHQGILTIDIFKVTNTSAYIIWTTNNASTSLIEYGLSAGNLNLSEFSIFKVKTHTLFIQDLIPTTTYYYKLTSTDSYITQSESGFSFNLGQCIENWQRADTACDTNDTSYINYVDGNGCGTTVFLPIDNGTALPCNYCSENLIQTYTSGCEIVNGSGQRSYIWQDINYYGCCALTGILSDCSVAYAPYNVSYYEGCVFLQQDFDIDADLEAFFGFGFGGLASDKVSGKIYINDSNNTYYCVSYVKDLTGVLVQTNPPYTKRTESTISIIPKEIEDREFFVTKKGLANVYWTDHNLIKDARNYIFGVECASDSGRLISEILVSAEYKPVNEPITRWFWVQENAYPLIIGGVILFILLFGVGFMIWWFKSNS